MQYNIFMPEKEPPEFYGLSPEILPGELEELVHQLESETHIPADKKSGFRTEAEHFWRDACEKKRTTPNAFIRNAVKNFRLRFRDQLHS